MNGKPGLTHDLEKALSALRYGQAMSDEARRLSRVADAELLLVIRKNRGKPQKLHGVSLVPVSEG